VRGTCDTNEQVLSLFSLVGTSQRRASACARATNEDSSAAEGFAPTQIFFVAALCQARQVAVSAPDARSRPRNRAAGVANCAPISEAIRPDVRRIQRGGRERRGEGGRRDPATLPWREGSPRQVIRVGRHPYSPDRGGRWGEAGKSHSRRRSRRRRLRTASGSPPSARRE
jgi:hypothetical protein